MATTLATQKGKDFALQALRARRAKNAKRKKIDNADLPAGSPMYFCCRGCGGLADVLSEEDFISPPKKLCDKCQALKNMGWFE